MRLGYSFWGFLGPGVTDTPDGGRSHRRNLIDALQQHDIQITFLQRNRDLAEAGDDLGGHYRFDGGLPELDALMLEWRWPIPGRNTTGCDAAGHTCDLHRQAELLLHYTEVNALPTIVWDKDRRLPVNDPLRLRPNVTICEPGLRLNPGAHRLLFPVDDRLLDAADPEQLAKRPRPTTLVYVGNQYDRDDAFEVFFAPAARHVDHMIAGKWPRGENWPDLNFLGRVPFPQVRDLHAQSLATMLLLPERYTRAGQVTQRIFEATLAGCVPLAPASIYRAAHFVPEELVVRGPRDVRDRLEWLRSIAGTARHAELLADCLVHLEPFRLSFQVAALEDVLSALRASADRGATHA